MDSSPPPPKSFSGRRRSSVISLGTTTATFVAPRKSSILEDDDPAAHPLGPTASDISARRSSATDPSAPPSRYSASSNISARKASTYDDDDDGNDHGGSFSSAASDIASRKASACDDGNDHAGGSRGSASDITARRATATDRPPWDSFAGAPPGNVGSTWGWVSNIRAITDAVSTPADRNRAFYNGNINYVIEHHNGQWLNIDDLEAIMHAYGVDETTVEEIVKKVDPTKSGSFYLNSSMSQILQASNIDLCDPPADPLTILRHASKCFGKKLLSPLHFAGFMIDILKGGIFLGNEPPFMILGLYSVLGVLEGGTGKLTTKDMKTFIGLWKMLKPQEADELIELIDKGFDGSMSSFDVYNMLYRRDVFGKQRIQMFDLIAPQDPRLFFTLMDKDEDGVVSSSDLRSFASVFRRSLTNEKINRVIGKLDADGDGSVSFEDYKRTIVPLFDGLTWEFWLAAIFIKLDL